MTDGSTEKMTETVCFVMLKSSCRMDTGSAPAVRLLLSKGGLQVSGKADMAVDVDVGLGEVILWIEKLLPNSVPP